MLNYIKFKLFGPVDPEAEKAALEALGYVMWQKLKQTLPELQNKSKEQETSQLYNNWVKDKSKELFAGRENELVKIQQKITWELNKIFK
ncbi:hypothetical protein A2375_02015 [Candidatus Woesebacteria bacterium RIFOXYB1_FULL_31_120]|nr:MAG: hypothetical protein A2375_02015 [Candidatus Woesebacteria bacterium RIFOXYB1_FULL_31_120]